MQKLILSSVASRLPLIDQTLYIVKELLLSGEESNSNLLMLVQNLTMLIRVWISAERKYGIPASTRLRREESSSSRAYTLTQEEGEGTFRSIRSGEPL